MLSQSQLRLLLCRLVFQQQKQVLLALLVVPLGLGLIHEPLNGPRCFCIPCIRPRLLLKLHAIRQELERLIRDTR